jgi:hypothetical protein
MKRTIVAATVFVAAISFASSTLAAEHSNQAKIHTQDMSRISKEAKTEDMSRISKEAKTEAKKEDMSRISEKSATEDMSLISKG